MNITVTDQEPCKKQLRIEIPGERVQAETNKAAANLARTVSVPGFRRGHVPTSVIKTRFRKELRDEVVSHLLPHALMDAIQEKELKVVGEPSIENFNFGDDHSIDVTFNLEVAPEFELAEYKNLPLTKRNYKVRDEDVEQTIDRMREQQSELVPVEDRGAQAGDILALNIRGRFEPGTEAAESEEKAASDEKTADSEAADQGSGEPAETAQSDAASKPEGEEVNQDEEINQEEVEIELGAEGLLPEFDEALAGVRPGETRTFTVNYPADFKAESYAGRRVNYTADVITVRTKELPEVDDAFAQGVSEDFKTADELRAELRKRLEHDAGHMAAEELRQAVAEKLTEANTFPVPESSVQRQIDTRLRRALAPLMNQGLDLSRLNLDWEKLRESHREQAEREIRNLYVLNRIAEVENIEVGENEVNQELERLAEGMGEDPTALRARLTRENALDSIKEQIRSRKALDFVIDSANLQTEEVEGLSKPEAATDNANEQAEGQSEA